MPAPRKAHTQPRSNTAKRLPSTAKRVAGSTKAVGLPALAASTVTPPALPALPGKLKYLKATVEAWTALWAEPQAEHLTGVQKVVALRWVRAFDEWLRALDSVVQAPMVQGSQGQPVANPMMGWVTSREAEMEKCEKQLGIGLRNKADLGLTIGQAKITAQQLIDMHHRRDASGADTDSSSGEEVVEEEAGWEAE